MPAATARQDPSGAAALASPARGSLAAAVAEVDRVAAAAEGLQAALSPLLRRGGEAVEAAQALDEITQHLQGLSQFLSVIARECPADWRLDVVEAGARLRLHSQKLRLTAPAAPSVTPEPAALLPAQTGELELW